MLLEPLMWGKLCTQNRLFALVKKVIFIFVPFPRTLAQILSHVPTICEKYRAKTNFCSIRRNLWRQHPGKNRVLFGDDERISINFRKTFSATFFVICESGAPGLQQFITFFFSTCAIFANFCQKRQKIFQETIWSSIFLGCDSEVFIQRRSNEFGCSEINPRSHYRYN